jgi:two-component system KDP operon response regulator KdpE
MKTILVVDDDVAVTELLGAKLRPSYRVVATTDPGKAVKLAVEGKPDLILCDVDMPAMNGAEVAAALRRAGVGGIPLLFLTGLVAPHEVEELPSGVDRHRILAKRAPVSELLASIKAVIGV